MPTYDICCIASARASPKHLTHLLKRIQGDLSSIGGMVRKVDHMGLRPLATPMKRKTKKHTVGRYFRLLVEASPKACMGIEHRLHVDDEIVRFRTFKSSLADVYEAPSSTWQHRPVMSEAHYDALRRTTNIDYYIARTLLTQGKITPEEMAAMPTHSPKLEPAVEAYEELSGKVPAALARRLFKHGLIKEVAGETHSEFLSAPTMEVAGLAEMLEPAIGATMKTRSANSATLAELSIHNSQTLNKPFPTKITSYQEENYYPKKGSFVEYREDWSIPSPTEAANRVDDYQAPESDREDLDETFKKYIRRDPSTFQKDMRKYLVDRGVIEDNFETLYPMRDPHSTYERKVTDTETEHILRGRPEPDPEVPGGLVVEHYHFRADRTLLKTVVEKIANPTPADWAFGVKTDKVRPDRTLWDGYPTAQDLPSDAVQRRTDRLDKMVKKVEREIAAARSRGLDLNEQGKLIFPDGVIVPETPKRFNPLVGDDADMYEKPIPQPEEAYKEGKHLEYIETYFNKSSTSNTANLTDLFDFTFEAVNVDENASLTYGMTAEEKKSSEQE